jgi:hypothetical protein
MAEGGRQKITLAFIAAGPALALGSPVLFMNDHFSVATRWWLGALAGVLVIAGAWLAARDVRSIDKDRTILLEKLAEERKETAEARLRVRGILQDHLFPITATLDRIAASADAADRRRFQQQLKQEVVTVATGVIGPEGTRSCLLEYFPETNDDDKQRRLECRAVSAGRNGAPRRRFESGTRDGDNMLDHLDRRAVEFCRNLDEDPPAGWDPRLNRPYKTFINVPVAVTDENIDPFGMLTIDGLKADDLTSEDIPFLEFLASLLAIGLSVGMH